LGETAAAQLAEQSEIGGFEQQMTTTELNSTPFEESSQNPKPLEEGVSEVYPEGVQGEQTFPPHQTPATSDLRNHPTSNGGNGQEQRDENDVKVFGGYSAYNGPSPSGESQDEFNKRKFNKLSLIMENYIPPFSNEIPRVYSVLRPIDQQQVENTFYQMRQVGQVVSLTVF